MDDTGSSLMRCTSPASRAATRELFSGMIRKITRSDGAGPTGAMSLAPP
jgi:hypothetical protein